jgi:membrane protease YdiL (CAAX protease family)
MSMTPETQRYVLACLVGIAAGALAVGFRPLGIDGDLVQLLCLGAASAVMFALLPEPLKVSRRTGWLLLLGLAAGVAVFFVRNWNFLENLRVVASNGLPSIVLGLLVSVVAIPIYEEKLCRQVMFDGLRRVMPVALSALLVSVAFGLAHRGAEILTFVFSLAMCVAALRGVGSWDRAILHGAWNLSIWLLQIYYGYKP